MLQNVQISLSHYYTINRLPVVDGHFWVVKDNKIIDPHFQVYDLKARIRCVSPNKNYYPAPLDVQQHFINLYKPYWQQRRSTHTISADNCMFNAFQEVERNGGEIVFGSMGFGDDGKIFWEYGDPSWRYVRKFLKK